MEVGSGKNITMSITALFFVVFAVLMLIMIETYNNKINNLEKSRKMIKEKLEVTEKEKEDLKKIIKLKEVQNNSYKKKIEEKTGKNYSWLIDDFVSHVELIDSHGVKGGTMSFYDKERIVILNEKWIYAPFDDGHINGGGVYQFTIKENGKKIVWKKVVSYINK